MSVIHYRTTDLDLVSRQPLAPLVEALEATGRGFALSEWKDGDGLWHATFEREVGQETSPEETICAFLDEIEVLAGTDRDAWFHCRSRAFDIAFDSGESPRSFQASLSVETLARINACGASLAITMYPPDPPEES